MPSIKSLIDQATAEAYQIGYARGVSEGESKIVYGLRSLAKLNGSGVAVMKSMDPERKPAPPNALAAIAYTMHAIALDSARRGIDARPELQALASLASHPASIDKFMAQTGIVSKSFRRLQTRVHFAEFQLVRKGFGAYDERKHPRDKSGRFISKDSIHEAKTDPVKAEQLRDRVKPEDADKLEDALSGKTDLGRTKAGERKHQTQQKRETKRNSVAEVMRVQRAMEGYGDGADVDADGTVRHNITAEHLEALAEHLPNLTVRQLREARTRLRERIKWGGRDKKAMVGALTRWAQGEAAGMRGKVEEQPEQPAEDDEIKLAPGIGATPEQADDDIKIASPEEIAANWDRHEAGQRTPIESKPAPAPKRDPAHEPVLNDTIHKDVRRAVLEAQPDGGARGHIADIHKRLPQYSKEQINAAIQELENNNWLSTFRMDDPRQVTQEMRATGIKSPFGDATKDRHIFYRGTASTGSRPVYDDSHRPTLADDAPPVEAKRFPSKHNPEVTYGNEDDRDSDDKYVAGKKRDAAKATAQADQIGAELRDVNASHAAKMAEVDRLQALGDTESLKQAVRLLGGEVPKAPKAKGKRKAPAPKPVLDRDPHDADDAEDRSHLDNSHGLPVVKAARAKILDAYHGAKDEALRESLERVLLNTVQKPDESAGNINVTTTPEAKEKIAVEHEFEKRNEIAKELAFAARDAKTPAESDALHALIPATGAVESAKRGEVVQFHGGHHDDESSTLMPGDNAVVTRPGYVLRDAKGATSHVINSTVKPHSDKGVGYAAFRATLADDVAPVEAKGAEAKPNKGKAIDLKTAPAGKLNTHIEKLREESTKLSDEMIEAGRGHETSSDIFTKTDPLSARYNENANQLMQALGELRSRKEYHGSDKPIRRKSLQSKQ